MDKLQLRPNSEVFKDEFSKEDLAVIRKTVAKGTNEEELYYFLRVAKIATLNPFLRQIWCYKDKEGHLIIFAGRDGFLSIAQRDKRWNGIFSTEVRKGEEFKIIFEGDSITIKHVKTAEKADIVGAFAYIKPKNCDTPTIEYVDFATYNKSQATWNSHPADMIKKVAETHALKKAFGIAGIYGECDFIIDKDNLATPVNTEVVKSELQMKEEQVREALDAYQGDDKDDLYTMLQEKKSINEVTIEFLDNILNQIQIDIEEPNE